MSTPVESDRLADAVKTIHELAVEGFAQHAITQEAPNRWRCGRPGSSIYAFRVVALPGAVVFYGDLGEAILRPSDRDVLPWLRGAVHSRDYLLEKVQPRPEQTFYVQDALDWTDEEAKELNTEIGERAKDLARFGDLSQEQWAQLVMDCGYDSECCGVGLGPSSASLWLVEALRWFIAHLDASTAAAQEHDGPTPDFARRGFVDFAVAPVAAVEAVR